MSQVSAAQQLLASLSYHPKTRNVVGQMSLIVDAYVNLAAAKVPDGRAPVVVFPLHIQREVQNLDLIPILSKNLEVQRDGQYRFSHFRSFSRNIRFVGGLNKPKLIACEDSEGMKYRELVKSGNDDLRQVRCKEDRLELLLVNT